MRFNNTTASSLSSLPVRIDHGNPAATGGLAMSANSTRTARNMSVDAVPASLAGTEHPQHASYLHAFQHVHICQSTTDCKWDNKAFRGYNALFSTNNEFMLLIHIQSKSTKLINRMDRSASTIVSILVKDTYNGPQMLFGSHLTLYK